ncbi:MAG TPA: VOC family protein [Dehalococcoidia bacterium]|nr:VOC family protein [Dehalococcoidia bacterium]
MLRRVDRMQLAVRDRAAAADTFRDMLGAETVREDAVHLLGARRTVVQAGESEFELLEPAGDGPVAAYLQRWPEGLFAAGFSTDDLDGLCARLDQKGVRWQEEGGQLHLEPEQTTGLRMVISPSAQRSPLGLITWLYEVTHIVPAHRQAAAFYADAFGLDASRFAPIKSERYGYEGTLTLFDPPARLDRIELTQISDPSLAMGRFFARRGPSIYMCFVETNDVAAIARRLEARGARFAAAPNPDEGSLFVHPSALHGVLMGVSRTHIAWTWSGHPELARP